MSNSETQKAGDLTVSRMIRKSLGLAACGRAMQTIEKGMERTK